MADVTDAACRAMFARYGKPDAMFTEFVSTDGLCSAGRQNLLRELIYHESERPIVAQIWGRNPEHFYQSAKLIEKLGFDGIDINLGCPQKKEMTQKTCAALIAEPKLVGKIIAETKRGAKGLPVSVKTRLGIRNIDTEKWVGKLLRFQPAAITLHARTAKEMSKVPAHWEEIAKAVKLRNRRKSETLILGNGDVKSLEEAAARVAETGCDGVMIGRGAFGNPWFFAPLLQKPTRDIRRSPTDSDEGGYQASSPSLKQRLVVMAEHAKLFERIFKTSKNFAVMRKHFKAYASGFEGAAGLRVKLMESDSSRDVERMVYDFLSSRIRNLTSHSLPDGRGRLEQVDGV